MVTRPAVEILSELAELSRRRGALEEELAAALREGLAPAPVAAAPAPGDYLTTREAAEQLGVSTRLLEAMRAEGRGPRFVRVGRAVRYLTSELGASGTSGVK